MPVPVPAGLATGSWSLKEVRLKFFPGGREGSSPPEAPAEGKEEEGRKEGRNEGEIVG
jgi:hypothetical protein